MRSGRRLFRRRRRRSAVRFALSLALVLALGAAALLWFRADVVERLAARELVALGLPDARFRIEAVGLRSARIDDVALAREIAARAVTFRYGLLPPELARIEVDGLRLDLSRPGEGALARLRESVGGGAGGAAPDVVLRDAVVFAETARGRVSLAFEGEYVGGEGSLVGALAHDDRRLAEVVASGRPDAFEARLAEEGGLVLRLQGGAQETLALQAEAELGGASALLAAFGLAAPPGTYGLRAAGDAAAFAGELTAQVSAAAQRISLNAPFAAQRTDEGAQVRFENATIAAPGLGLRAQGAVGALTIGSAPTLALTKATLETPWTRPAQIALSASLTDDGDAEFEGAATIAGARLAIGGRHDPSTGAGGVDLALGETAFGAARQPGDLLPALADIRASEGTASGAGALRWTASGFEGEAVLNLSQLSFAAPGAEVSALGGELRFSSLLPPATPPGQELRAAQIAAGVALDDVRLRFQLDGPSGALVVERLRASFAGGRLTVADARLQAGERNAFALQVHDADLAQLLALIGLEGLSGDGRISGVLPLVLDADDVAIEGGELAAAGPGALRFRSAEVRQALAAGGEYVALALDALEDFRYERLSLGVDKELGGAARIRLSTLGANPAVLDGQPFAINVNLTGDADRLVEAALAASRLSDQALGAIVRGR